ncbi:MAG: U32 family peptidase, partial [Treponema sp.]|nr:U32 family peptidase [Treponema sp.]
MELLSPAGNLDKLKTVYNFGADAAYIGIRNFSLRRKSDNFHQEEYDEIKKMKGEKKLYGALNIYFHHEDLQNLENHIDYLSEYPFDAFIISDLGIIDTLQKHFPHVELHLSTQANCINREAAKVYSRLGFSRIILGRETPLDEIKRIKDAIPDTELECFVHGAMCLAYSGRCFLSKYMADRSANQGLCAHSCRWDYRLLSQNNLALEEKERPGEYFPIEESDGFTTILSSKDLCMIDHLKELQDAGIDSIKIEGRMKSAYYAAVITRAYRKHLDALNDPSSISKEDLDFYREELFKVSHREFSTGFFFGKDEIERPNTNERMQSHQFLGSIGNEVSQSEDAMYQHRFELNLKNKIIIGEELEIIGPDLALAKTNAYRILNKDGAPMEEVNHMETCTIEIDLPLQMGYLLRRLPHD